METTKKEGVPLIVLVLVALMVVWCAALTAGVIWLFSVVKPAIIWASQQPYVVAGILLLLFLLVIGETRK